jgi:Protein of unknown function (DUF3667)
VTTATCANCDAPLAGPYCSQCGQHVHDSARTLGALLHDGWHVVTHVDGRFWQTLATLALKPGALTVEYFAARRARYLPPVRLYLVLSVLFFALVSLTNDWRVVELTNDPDVSADVAHARDDARAALDEARRASAAGAATARGSRSGGATAGTDSVRLPAKPCEGIETSSEWFTKALHDVCVRGTTVNASALRHSIGSNLPKMMFVFLPLMAGVMLLLYWWPRRLYVEHLVFFLHVHAALYLMLIPVLAFEWLADSRPALGALVGWVQFAGFLYAAWYVYRALRTYYGQRRALTLLKLAVVGFAYLVFLGVTVGATALISLFTA